ncbi:DUF2285 domain-containing protein [Gymnodinialimonas sp. 2305UL16-5]|uniref:DUF2285 domain-containing protein n=1 Tax=Gymnodinialimonas mytili TaxID=3126503 RepID=UPI0030B7A33D
MLSDQNGKQHTTDDLKKYLRLLDAEAEGADWKEIASLLLEFDVTADPDIARQIYMDELYAAHELAEDGYLRFMLKSGRG